MSRRPGPAVRFETAAADSGDGLRLLDAMRADIAVMYDGQDLDAEDMPRAGPAELGPPHGTFLVGRVDGAAVCCGGVKRLDDTACELKRMYVVPALRGQGVARRLLGALEDAAIELGYGIARLDTGPRQLDSRHVFETSGYRPIANFNANPVATYFGEKRIGFDRDAYLARLDLTGGEPDLATLHRSHVHAIPFENLDPVRGASVSLRLGDLTTKLVDDRRGGYCFEHNRLFAAALHACGLGHAEPMLARVGPRDVTTRSLTHLLLRVTTDDGVWHADVGFGAGTLLEPIPFGPGPEVVQSGWRRRVVEADHGELALQIADADGQWRDVYTFVPRPVPDVDIEMSNCFTATHPSSRFVDGLVVTRNHADGTRTVLSDWSGTLRLMHQTPDSETSRDVPRASIPELLAERFELDGWTLDDRGRPQRATAGEQTPDGR